MWNAVTADIGQLVLTDIMSPSSLLVYIFSLAADSGLTGCMQFSRWSTAPNEGSVKGSKAGA